MSSSLIEICVSVELFCASQHYPHGMTATKPEEVLSTPGMQVGVDQHVVCCIGNDSTVCYVWLVQPSPGVC